MKPIGSLKPKRKLEAEVTAEIKQALQIIGLWPRYVWKHWSGMGSAPGISDLMGVIPGIEKAFYCEIKRPGGKLSPAQADFLGRMREAGAIAFMADKVETVRDVLLNAGYAPAKKLRGWVTR